MGNPLETSESPGDSEMSNSLLEIRELSKRFGGLIAVENVSFDIYAGEILGLIGPNGAGKTTIFNLLAGALKADAGSIIMDGKSLLYQPLHRIAELGVMRTFQHNSPFPGMSLVDNILVGAHTCFDSSWFSILTNSASAMRMEKQQRSRVVKLIEFVGLSELVETEVDNLSFGQGRLLELARALAGEPRVILLDEPAAGLTLNEADRLSKIIRDISDRGIAVLLIEHDMRFLMPLAQRVAVLNFGVKIADGAPDEIRRNPDVIAAYLGESRSQLQIGKEMTGC